MDGAAGLHVGLRQHGGEHLLIGLAGPYVGATHRTGKKTANAYAFNIGITIGQCKQRVVLA